jgi:hypothetical protein
MENIVIQTAGPLHCQMVIDAMASMEDRLIQSSNITKKCCPMDVRK